MNIDINQIALILKDFKFDISVLRSKQVDLLKKVKKAIDVAKLDRINENLNKKQYVR